MKPCKIPQNKTTCGIFKKGGPLDNCKKGGPEAIASFASPNIHHCLHVAAKCNEIKFCYIKILILHINENSNSI